jgi:acetylornithine deacetylase/succinyl-diaminopimelate desuccinylase-like protein
MYFLEAAGSFIQKKQAYFLQTLKKLVAIRSVCGDQSQITQAVDFIRHLLQTLFACHIKKIETGGSPIILCELGSASTSKKPLLFYGHYDVMPAEDLENWQTDPFELSFKADRLYGRGAGDNKGQLLGVIFGLYVYDQLHHGFPCKIKLLIEGEEEKGSRHLAASVKKLAENELKDIQTVFVIDGSFNSAGQHVLRLGNRGFLGFEITLKTNATDVHSGNYGNVLANPVFEFYQLLTQLYNFEENKVRIPYFYEGIKKISAAEKELLQRLPQVALRKNDPVSYFKTPADSFAYYKKLMFEPTFNINGLQSGFMGSGIKTIIPGQAKARFDCRLVTGQSIEKIKTGLNQLLAPWIKQRLVEISYLNETPPYYAGITTDFVEQIIGAIRKVDAKAVIEPVMPGTVPNYVWQQNLAAQVYTIPLANFDQHNHAPNENLKVTAYLQGIQIIYQLVTLFAA